MGLRVVDRTNGGVQNISGLLLAYLYGVYYLLSRYGDFLVVVFIFRIASLWVRTVVVRDDVFGREEGVFIKMIDGSGKLLVSKGNRCRYEVWGVGTWVQTNCLRVAMKTEHR